jgi:hypothetical protein
MVAKTSDSGQPFLSGTGVLEKLQAESVRLDPTDTGKGDRDWVLSSGTFDLERQIGSDRRDDLAVDRAAWSGEIDEPALSGNIVPAKPNGIVQRQSVMRPGAH